MPKRRPEASAEQIRRAALERHGSLFVWMLENRDTLAPVLKSIGRPNWKEQAKRFAKMGLRDSRGGRPSGETARRTWLRVEAAAPMLVPGDGGRAQEPVVRAPPLVRTGNDKEVPPRAFPLAEVIRKSE